MNDGLIIFWMKMIAGEEVENIRFVFIRCIFVQSVRGELVGRRSLGRLPDQRGPWLCRHKVVDPPSEHLAQHIWQDASMVEVGQLHLSVKAQ